MKVFVKSFIIFTLLFLLFSCRSQEDEKPKIEKITLETEDKRIIEGEIGKIAVIVEPAEAKAYDTIEYRVDDNSILQIMPESDNDNVVFKGLKQGKAIITATANGKMVFSYVTIISSNGTLVPYITLSNYIIESEKGENHIITASLIGGNPVDDMDFVWSWTNQNKNIIDLVPNNNVAVIDTVNIGSSMITVSHKKSTFSVNALIFVKEGNEAPVYITTNYNVVNMRMDDNIREYTVNLVGLEGKDYHLFRHELINENNIAINGNENDVIKIEGKNNVGTIRAKGSGIAKIRISHQEAEYPIEIVVIIVENIDYSYIDVDNTLVVMNEGNIQFISANIAGNVPEDYIEKYEFINEDDSVVEVNNSGYTASLYALKAGKSVITIKNEYIAFNREVLVIVNGIDSIVSMEKYITSSQNVITTEINTESVLTMTLVGGNSADVNSFEWTVDDGTIIEMVNQAGEVKYNHLRSMRIIEEEKYEVVAVIRALKVGITTIKLEHPKAMNSFTITVKVYNKGVFGAIPIVLRGPGLYKIHEGENVNAFLGVATGLSKDFNDAQWISSDENVFKVVSNTKLEGVLNGVESGIATLTVKGRGLKHEYSATVIVGSDDYIGEKPYLYINAPYKSVIKGNTFTFKIDHENVDLDTINNLSVVNNSRDKIDVFSFRNNVTVKGLELGEAEIVVSGAGLNTLKIKIFVEDYKLTPEMPYFIRAEQYIYGMVKGRSVEIPIELVGGITKDEKDIGWNIVDDNIADIKKNGKKCLVTGKNEGQTVIKVSHPKSNNTVEIVVYVVLSDAELRSKVIIHVSEQNMLLKYGETKFVSITTNATELQDDFRWSSSNANVIGLRVSSNKLNAYIDTLQVGNAVVMIGYGNQTPIAVYVSVINEIVVRSYVSIPSIVEMVVGQTININAVVSGDDIFFFNWESGDESIAKVYGNDKTATVTAINEGRTVIEVKANGFEKNVVLIVYKTNEEMANAYILASEETRYVINKGDIINIGLVFGLKGYPEHDIVNIRWGTDTPNVISIKKNGKNASIEGLIAGVGIVTVKDNYGNDIKIKVIVQDYGKVSKYSFVIDGNDRIKGILSGKSAEIQVKVFNGLNEVYNIEGIQAIVEKSDIINVERSDIGIKVFALAGKEGQSYITLKHDLVEDTRILIYTSFTESGLLNAYPLLIEKSNYLVEVGNSFDIAVQTIDNNPNKLSNIHYRLEKNSGIINIQERNKREIKVEAEKEGTEVIYILYNTDIVQRVYVSVVARGYNGYAGYLVTENIIGLYVGQEYETRVDTDYEWGIEWKSENENICKILEIEGKNAILAANNVGKTYIVVKKGNIERYILIFVVNEEREIDSYKAVNIEQRNYSISKGKEITLFLSSFQGNVEGNTLYEDYYKYSVPYGNVIEINKVNNGKLSVKGLNEGVAAVKITNEYYQFECIVYIEVAPVYDGGISVSGKEYYITAEKTLYIIEGDSEGAYINVGVVPDNFYGDSKWEWSYKGYEDIIEVEAVGRSAMARPLQKGSAKILVFNSECENTLEITVIVGERYVINTGKTPYIFVEKDLFEVTLATGEHKIGYEIRNVENVAASRVTFTVSGESIRVNIDRNNQTLKIETLKIGVSKIELKYNDLRREIYVLVKANLNVGNVYFTTSENFVIVSIGELRKVDIDLIGYDEIDGNNVVWELAAGSPRDIVQLVGNGLTGQLYGIREGTVSITIKHVRTGEYQALYPLNINVKVVKDKSKEKIVYLTTQRNVIETVKGAQSEMLYVQKVGGDPVKSDTVWRVDNETVISIRDINGYSARMYVNGDGFAKITVHNVEADYDLVINVVVLKSTGSNIYLQSTSTLLWLSPGEKNHKITVDLINGEKKDYSNIDWKVYEQFPYYSDPEFAKISTEKVINIISSNEQCYIDALNVGVAHIRVSCLNVDVPLIITVYVSHYKTIQFSESHKDIVKGEIGIVEINLPSYERMKDKAHVWAVDVNGIDITKAVEVYYTDSLVLINAVNVGHAIIKAEVAGKEGTAEMTVTVLEKYDPNVTRMVVGKTLQVFSVKSGQQTLNAGITGPGILESDYDNIKWEITRNYDMDNDVKKEKPLLDIIPKNMPPSTVKSQSRTVQITPNNIGNAIIRVTHDRVTPGYHKDIYVVVADMNNKFTMNKKEVTVNMARPETVAVDIIGGTTKDYNEVRWVAKMQQKWDGTMLEVVRVMGSGKEVILYPIANGETEVFAFYDGLMVSVKVNVVSDYSFSMINANEFMYPGEVRNLYYDIAPASNSLSYHYIPDPATGAVVSVADIQGSQPGGEKDAKRFVQITALKEGMATITFIPTRGLPCMVNIVVNYDYEFTLNNNDLGIVYTWNKQNPAPKYSDSSGSSTGITTVTYQVYPADTYIKCVSPIPDGLTVQILDPILEPPQYDTKGRRVGNGTIIFTGLREMKAELKFQHYKARLSGAAEEAAPSSRPSKPSERTIVVYYYFKDGDFFPFFVRGEGEYSNRKNNQASENFFSRNTAARWQKDNTTITGSESIVANFVTLGDGEEHYIYFDKQYESQAAKITGLFINTPPGYTYTKTQAAEGSKIQFSHPSYPDTTFEAQIVDITYNNVTQKAIRLSGGKDHINYNRVAFDQELIIETLSGHVAGGVPEYIDAGEKLVFDTSYYTYRYNNFTVSSSNNTDNIWSNRVSVGVTLESTSYYARYAYVISNYYNASQCDEIIYNAHSTSYYRYRKPTMQAIKDGGHYIKINGSGEPYFISDNVDNSCNSTTFKGTVTNLDGMDWDNFYWSQRRWMYVKEKSSRFSVYRNKYINDDGTELNNPPSARVYLNGLNSNIGRKEYIGPDFFSTNDHYDINKIASSYHIPATDNTVTHKPEPVMRLLYGNLDTMGETLYGVPISDQIAYGHGSGNMFNQNPIERKGGQLGKSIENSGTPDKYYYNNDGFNDILKIFRDNAGEYSIIMYPAKAPYTRHSAAPDGGCLTWGNSCYGYFRYVESGVRHRYYWIDNGSYYIVPCYILNKYPYRIEINERIENGKNIKSAPYTAQYIGIDEGGGKPMPSINRALLNNKVAISLTVQFEVIYYGTGNENGKKYASKTIDLYPEIRECHSKYNNTTYTSDNAIISYSRNNVTEMEGAITDMNNLPQNSDIRKYFKNIPPR